jgi:hypothetical protein
VSLIPDPVRNEQINVGIVGFYEGRVKAHFINNPQRIKLLSPQYDTSRLFEDFQRLLESSEIQEGLEMVSNLGDEFVRVYPEAVGTAKDYMHFEMAMSKLYDRLIKPLVTTISRPKVTRLKRTITETLRKKNILGEKIESKKIVSNYVIAEAEALIADFAYTNGHLNIIETIDFRFQTLMAKFKDTAVSVVKLDSARKKLDGNAKGIFIYYPPKNDILKIGRHQSLLADYYDKIYNYADKEQMSDFYTGIEKDLGHLLI